MKAKNFKHVITEKVKFHEVDLLGVCNNAVYFNYFEDARIQYINDIVSVYKLNSLLSENKYFIMAHNSADYIKPAQLDDELLIYSKITKITNSSFHFDHLVINANTNKILTEGKGVVVYLSLKTRKSLKLPKKFYEAVNDYEKGVQLNRG